MDPFHFMGDEFQPPVRGFAHVGIIALVDEVLAHYPNLGGAARPRNRGSKVLPGLGPLRRQVIFEFEMIPAVGTQACALPRAGRQGARGARPRVGPYVQVDFCRVRRHPVGMRKERGLVVAVPISLSRPTQRNYSVLSVRFGRESSSGRGCLFALLKTDHDQMSNQAILGRMFC